jgi:hypothetical protein
MLVLGPLMRMLLLLLVLVFLTSTAVGHPWMVRLQAVAQHR